MKFKKVMWFYETEVNGDEIAVAKQDTGLWRAMGARGQYGFGKTRQKAVENYIERNRGE